MIPKRTSDRSLKARRPLGLGLLLLSILPIAAASGIDRGAVSGQAQEPLGRLIADACEDGNPFYIAAHSNPDTPHPGLTSVSLFRDGSINEVNLPNSDRVALLNWEMTGKILGVAYNPKLERLYFASNYAGGGREGTSDASPDLPAGLGGVFEFQLDPISLLATTNLDAGTRGSYERAFAEVGTKGLGDIDVDSNSGDVLVVNLGRRSIDRLRHGGLQLVRSYPLILPPGVAAADTHPFGIDVHEGFVYHGLTVDDGPDRVYAFVSRIELSTGRGELVFSIELDYGHSPPWTSWEQWEQSGKSGWPQAAFPLVSDLEVLDAEHIALGLMNRYALYHGQGIGFGDVLIADNRAGAWRITDPDLISERGMWEHLEGKDILLGMLAYDRRQRRILASGENPGLPFRGFQLVTWFSQDSGRVDGPADGREPFSDDDEQLGDIESTCDEVPATATPSASPSPTPSSTATASPSHTATHTPPPPIYLPLLLRQQCRPEDRRVDVVLVFDASSSMSEPTSAGRTKLDAALAASLQLVAALDFSAGDRAGLVVFSESVSVDHPLSSDRAGLESALASVRAAPGTCIPCGLEAGLNQIRSAGLGSARTPALVILTDGRSNTRPITEAVEMAEVARREGVEIFAIGLGEEVEEAALRRMVSRPGFYYRTLDAEALAEIFRAIVREIPCPGGARSHQAVRVTISP
jgi:Mg-chelatase subunit ChlD